MKFTAKTEDQIARESLLDAGEYDFEVANAEDKVSKAGNDMIELTLKVFRPDGGFIPSRDYLMEKMAFKLIHFCKSVGLMPSYDAGTLTAQECVGRAGRLKLVVEEQPGYQPRNAVKDYIAVKDGEAAKTTIKKPAPAAAADDGVPF